MALASVISILWVWHCSSDIYNFHNKGNQRLLTSVIFFFIFLLNTLSIKGFLKFTTEFCPLICVASVGSWQTELPHWEAWPAVHLRTTYEFLLFGDFPGLSLGWSYTGLTNIFPSFQQKIPWLWGLFRQFCFPSIIFYYVSFSEYVSSEYPRTYFKCSQNFCHLFNFIYFPFNFSQVSCFGTISFPGVHSVSKRCPHFFPAPILWILWLYIFSNTFTGSSRIDCGLKPRIPSRHFLFTLVLNTCCWT